MPAPTSALAPYSRASDWIKPRASGTVSVISKTVIPPDVVTNRVPFDLPEVGLRGRLVRLDLTSSRALSAHALPEPAARYAIRAVA